MYPPSIEESAALGFPTSIISTAKRAAVRLAGVALIQAAALALAPSAAAQAQDTLLQSIAGPETGFQPDVQLGFSVAVDGNLTVVGAPRDDIGGTNSGVVKVFNTTTGALLHLIPNPVPAAEDLFGISVAISGTRVVVGASQDDTGATDAGSAYVFDLSSGTPTAPVAILNNPGPAINDLFGRSVSISGMRVIVGADQDDTGASNAGSAYLYDLASGTPTVPVATLNNPGPPASDRFGWSVGISGDRLVVGAFSDDTAATNAGSAYVYDFSGGLPPVLATTLTHPAPAANDQFGYSVAISGDRVVVGARNDDTGAGSAHVFDIDTPATPEATLTNPSPATTPSFGYSVAISGARVVVAAPYDETSGATNGIACVYDMGSGTPTVPLASYNAPTATTGNWFGRSVAVSGTQVVVGSPNEDTGASDSGSAYIYDFTSGTPAAPTITLNSPGPASANLFGYSVSVSGTRMVVGTPSDDTGAANSGRAYIYNLASATPTTPVITINNPAPTANDFFGSAVAISGGKVVIGAPSQDTGASNAGSAYVYDLDGGTPGVPVRTLNNPSPATDDNFGFSVAISGDRVLVGAYRDNTGATDAGSAYLYHLTSPTPTVPTTVFNNPSPAAQDYFGFSVAVSNDRAAIGAYQDDTVASDAGSVYVYDLNSVTPETTAFTLNHPGLMASDWYGYALGIAGNRLIVGTPLNDTGATNAGSAYAYDISGATPTQTTVLNNPSPVAFDNFGRSVAISTARVLIGVPYKDTGASEAGSAHVYDLNGITPTLPVATLNNPNPSSSDQFGVSLAISGKTCVIGVPEDDSMLPNSGAAFVFGPAAQIIVEQPAGTPLPESGAAVGNGTVFVGASAAGLTYTIRNNGTAPLNNIAVALSGTNPGDFVLSTVSTASSLLPGASTTFSVQFQPTAAGARTASLSITSDNGDVNPFVITLNGTGALPAISVTVAPGSVTEDGVSNLVYTFTRSGPTVDPLTVSFNVTGTAAFGTDYTQSGADTFSTTSGTVTFTAGNGTASVMIDPSADTTFEADETAILTVASGSGYVVGTPNTASGTITNDDTEVTVAVAPSSVTEDGATNLVYTFTRSGPTVDPLTVSFNVSGTTLFPTDYGQSGADTFTTTSGTVIFAAASSTASVTIDPSADTTFEADKTAILTVASGIGYVVGTPNSASGTITNDDTEVSIAVTPSSVTEDGATNLVYTFTRSGPTVDPLTVSFNVTGTAAFGTDYGQSGADTFSTTTGTVIIAAGNNAASVTIDPSTDTAFEADETAILTVASGSGYVVGTPNSASGTINNDDTEVSVAVAPLSVTEDGASNLVYTFTRNGSTIDPLTVSFNVSGTALFGTDYGQSGADTFTTTSGTVTFTAGNGTASVTVDPSADTTFEVDETAILTVAAGSGYIAGTPNTATGTITNDDTEVSVAVTPSSVTEDGATNLVYTFTRSGPTVDPLTVAFNVTGTAAFGTDYGQSGADTFSTTSGTVIFTAGNSTASVTIDPSADTTFEADETAILTIASGSGYVVGTPNSASGTINNDDTEVSVAVAPLSVTEDGASNLVYTFTRNGSTIDPLTVSFNVSGTALFGADYGQSGADTFTTTSGTVTFTAGNGTASVTVDPSADTTFEVDETAILTVASGSGYVTGSPNTATGTINNDDTEVSVSVAPSSVTEDGATNLVYTFTRSGPTVDPLTVSFNVSGSALFGTDYSQSGADTFSATSGTIIFTAGNSTASVTIDPSADTTFEADENAILSVASGSGYVTGSPNTATGTINNDDTEVSVAVAPSSVTEDGATNLVYTFTRSGSTVDPLTVSFNVTGTALFGTDYSQSGADTFSATSGTIIFTAGNSTASLTIDPSADTTFEADETAILTVAAGSGYVTGSPNAASGTITNDDTEVSVAVAPSNVTEDGATNLVYTFTRSGPTVDPLTVSFNVTGTALFGTDYGQSGADTFNSTSGTVIFAAGNGTASVTLDPSADTTFEADETAILTVASGSGYVVGSPNTASGTITNDDTEVSVAVAPSSVTEDGATNMVYTFTRSGPTVDPLTVSFNVTGTAAFGIDYGQSGADTLTTSSGTVTFAAGNSTASVTIDPTADTTFEVDETAILTVAAGSGYVAGTPNTASGTITNDDTEVSVAVTPLSVTEDGATNLVYTFTRSGPTVDPLTVAFNVSGSAAFGTDYTQSGADTFTTTSGTVTFTAASSTTSVTVDPSADTTFEVDETAILTVASGSGYVVGTPNSASGTITNDDTEVSVAVAPSNVTENGASNLAYTFTRNGPTVDPLTVSFNVTGTALFGIDYGQSGADTFNTTTGTIIFTAGNSTASVTLDPSADTTFEVDETAILTVAAGSGYIAGTPNTATGTITNDDTEVSVSVAPSSVTEDGATNLVYTFTRSGPTADSLTVSFSVTGTAAFGTDYGQSGADTFNTTTGTVTFTAASSTASVTVDPSVDTTFEADETAILTVTSGSGYVVGTPNTATGTINNDDTEVTVAVAPSSVTEDGASKLVYTFTRSGPTVDPLTVSFNVTGTALFGTDYGQSGADTFTTTSGTVTFTAASSTASVTIDPSTDTAFEADETAILTVAAGSGYVTGSPNTATGTINNDDTEVTVAVAPSSVTEDGASNLVYTFTRSGPTVDPLTVSFNVTGTALFGTDYGQSGAETFSTTTGTVIFAAGNNTASVTIDPSADTTFEVDETAILTVAAGSGYVVGSPNTASGTITNDDTEVTVAVAPSSVTEDGASNLVYTFTRNGSTIDPLTVSFNVSGTALFGTDYGQSGANTFNTTSGTVTFAAASSTASVTLDPSADTAFEADETAILTVAAGSGYVTGSPNTATGSINNDDTPDQIVVEQPEGNALTSGSSTVNHGSLLIGDSNTRTFVIRNAGALPITGLSVSVLVGPASADFIASSTPGTLAAGSDTSFTVTFTPSAAGSRAATLRITSDNIGTTPFDVALTGNGATARGLFDEYVALAGLIGPNAQPGDIPFGDGVTNLIKYACNLNASGPDARTLVPGTGTAGLPVLLQLNSLAPVIRYEFLRRKNSGLTYMPLQSTTLAAGSWTPMTGTTTVTNINTLWERVVIEQAITPVKRFFRMQVILDESNNDPQVNVAVSPLNVTENGAGNLVYTFTRSGSIATPLTVSFNVTGTALFGTDYGQSGSATFSTTSGTIIIAAGSSSASVTIDPTADSAFEADETAVLTITSGSGYVIGLANSATATISNDDAEVSVAVAPGSVTEDGATNLVYTFTRNGPTVDPLTVSFNVTGTAEFGTDYGQSGATAFNTTSGTVIFAAGNSTASVTIDPTADTALEADETAILTITPGSGYDITSPNSASGTINNDDTEVSVAVAPGSITEDGATNLVYTFTRNGPTTNPLTVSFNVTGSALFGTDYGQSGASAFNATSGTVTFAAASSTASVTVDPSADTAFEADETAIFTVSAGSGYVVGSPNSASGTITNDDTEVSVAVAPSSVTEDGATNMVYTFTRNGPTANPLTVSFNVSGSALFGTDYTQSGADTFNTTSGTVTFTAASSTASVTIDPSTDTASEVDETAILTVVAGSGYVTGSPNSASGTITNDDTQDQIVVEQPEGNALTSGSSTVNHGSPLVGTPSSRTFVIRNAGALPITGLAVSVLVSPASADFIASSTPASLAAGSDTSFTVTFTPSAAGSRSATLRITSDNIGTTPFDIALTGNGSTARDLFDEYVTLAGLTGPNAQPGATPFSDGVSNLIKYACNMDASGPDVRTLVPGTGTAGLPVLLQLNSPAPVIRYEFLRRKNSGLTYTPLQSTTLANGSWTPMTGTSTVTNINTLWERVVIEQAVTPDKLFFRMQVVMD